MMVFRSVRVLVEHMFMFWDATSGEGILGLKGLAVQNLGDRKRRGTTARDTDDLIIYITDLFRKQQEIRNWQAVPALLQLDA